MMSPPEEPTIRAAAVPKRPAGVPRRERRTRTGAVPDAARRAPDARGVAAEVQDGREALAGDRLELCERQLIELNHRIANTLQIASGLIRAQQSRVADPIAKEALNAAVCRLEAIARLHRHLCRDGAGQRLDLGRFIEEIVPAIEGASGLACEIEVEPVEVPGEVALQVAIAVTELVLNARKHAYGGQDGGQVRISCRRDLGGRLHLSVADRGRGLPSGFDPRLSTGLGMGIVGATVRQFGGELLAESDLGGARFTLLLPLP